MSNWRDAAYHAQQDAEREWIEEGGEEAKAQTLNDWLETAMVHECAFAVNPFDKRVEYCQICGVLRGR